MKSLIRFFVVAGLLVGLAKPVAAEAKPRVVLLSGEKLYDSAAEDSPCQPDCPATSSRNGEQLVSKIIGRGVDTLHVVYFPSAATLDCVSPALCVAPSVVVWMTR